MTNFTLKYMGEKDRRSLEEMMDILKDWIYAELPPEGVDFKEIEEAMGFKLFIWQKYFGNLSFSVV